MGFHIAEQEPTSYEDVLVIARTTPRIADDDPRIEIFQKKGADPFYGNPIAWGNNFFLLWHSLKDGTNEVLKQVYRDRALATVGFSEVLESNQPLVADIFAALDAKEPADILDRKYMDLINRGIADDDLDTYMVLATHIGEQVGHPMGTLAVSLYAWDKLAPLLQQMGEQMSEAGIPYRDFCG